MTKKNMITEIQNWFQATVSVEFELPDGHYGRPHDGGYSLKSIHAEEDKLFVEVAAEFAIDIEGQKMFGTSIMFIFQGSPQVRVVDVSPDAYQSHLFHPIYRCLEIYNFQFLALHRKRIPHPYSTRFDGKKPEIEECRFEYDEGIVRFISDKALDEGFIG